MKDRLLQVKRLEQKIGKKARIRKIAAKREIRLFPRDATRDILAPNNMIGRSTSSEGGATQK